MGYKHDIEDILDKGSELIRKKGYHNVGINEILKVCEIPKGSFYNFFDSKEDFAHKMVDQYGAENLKMVSGFLEVDTHPPLDRLKQLYATMIDFNEQDGLDAGCLINNMSVELGGINPALAKVADDNFQKIVNVIAACVEEGQEAGEIIKTYPARDLAELLHAGLSGAFSRMKATRNRAYLDKWYQMTFDFISA